MNTAPEPLSDVERLRNEASSVRLQMQTFHSHYQATPDLRLGIGQELSDAYGQFSQVVLALESECYRLKQEPKRENVIL